MLGLQGRYNVALPDWMMVLRLAEQWHVPPWEIDDSDPPAIWVIRQMSVDAIRHKIDG
jgi:hypothetical protein